MEKWLIEELKNKARMEQFDKERKAHLSVKCRSDFDVPNPTEIKSLNFDQYEGTIDSGISVIISRFIDLRSISFSSHYQGKIHPEKINTWLSTLSSVEKLSFSIQSDNSITWDTLAALDLSRIKSLTVTMQHDSKPIPLIAPVLEEFTFSETTDDKLSGIERCCHDRNMYDFSGMPSLRKVKLSHCGFWDYASLSCLHRLDSIEIEDRNLMNLTWLSSNYSLSTLIISACIDDLSGIETQPSLENLYLGCNNLSDITALGKLSCLKHLDLRGNSISNVAPLENLKFLEYLNLDRNPLVSEGDLRNKRIRTLLLNSQDKTLDRIDRLINGFSQQVYWWIRNEDICDLSRLPEWQRNTTLMNRQKPYEERLMTKIQFVFEQKFQKINPFDLRQDDLRINLRKEYISRASEKYPFLKPTTDMLSALYRESRHLITKVPEIPGVAFFANEDFVRVHVKVQKGSGLIWQRYDKNYSRPIWMGNSRKIESTVKKIWDVFFPNKKITEFDFQITYASLYGKELDDKITYAVLFAMWSAIHQIVVPQKTAILLKCSGSGRLKKEEASLSQIKVSLHQGIENIISWMPKNKAARHSFDEQTLYNTLDEFVADLHRQEKLHYKYKDLDSFRLKLVDVIQNHISDIEDPRRIQSILRDFFPDKKKEVNLLVLLFRMNIMDKIKKQSSIDNLFVSKFVSMLENEYGISSESAKYAVHSWCLCYGKYVLDKPCDL